MASLPDNIHRRRVIIGGLLASAGLALAPSSVWASVSKIKVRQSQFLDILCDLVIPSTDTPGAREVGVPEFVIVAQNHGLRGASPTLLQNFEMALNKHAGEAFIGLGADRQYSLLNHIDEQVFSRTPDSSLTPELGQWRVVKALIVVGYYTSQIGSSKELRYNLVPGRFDPDVPADKNTRAWSSDWTGVKYG